MNKQVNTCKVSNSIYSTVAYKYSEYPGNWRMKQRQEENEDS